MIDDLRHFKRDDAFQIISEETAAALLLCLVAVLMVLDLLGAFL